MSPELPRDHANHRAHLRSSVRSVFGPPPSILQNSPQWKSPKREPWDVVSLPRPAGSVYCANQEKTSIKCPKDLLLIEYEFCFYGAKDILGPGKKSVHSSWPKKHTEKKGGVP